MSIETPDGSSLPVPIDTTSGLIDHLLNRREHTVLGCAIGAFRDLANWENAANGEPDADPRSNDELAGVAVDTAAFLPTVKWAAAGILRATLLADPHAGVHQNLSLAGENFLEGAACNCVGRWAAPGSFIAASTETLLGRGLLAESFSHLTVGMGMGAVKTGFNPGAWTDAGRFSATTGLENIIKAACLGGVASVPAGILGSRINRAAGLAASQGRITSATAGLIQSWGSGYLTGTIFGSIDALAALKSGKSGAEIVSQIHDAGVMGLLSNTLVHTLVPANATGFSDHETRSYLFARESPAPAAEQSSVSGDEINAMSSQEIGRLSAQALEADHTAVESLEFAAEAPSSGQDNYSRLHHLGNRMMSFFTPYKPGEVPPEQLSYPIDKVKSLDEFQRIYLKEVKRPVRVYSIDGHQIEMIVPEEYARILDRVRSRRWMADLAAPDDDEPLRAEILAAREELNSNPLKAWKDVSLPEDFIAYLDRLPDRLLAKRLIIHYESDPADPWSRKTNRYLQSTAADASTDGTIRVFQANSKQWLDGIIAHESGHLIDFNLEHEDEMQLYRDLAQLTKNGYYSSNYARSNVHERFAEHLAELLNPDADRFFIMAYSDPLGTVAQARALAKIVGNAAPSARSVDHRQIMNRIAFIEKHVLPRAQDSLVEMTQSENSRTRQLAVDALGRIGDRSHIELLKELALFDDGLGVATHALYALEKLVGNPKEMFDLAAEIGLSDSTAAGMARAALIRLGDPRLKAYQKLFKAAGVEGVGLPNYRVVLDLIEQMPDPLGKRLAFEAAVALSSEYNDYDTMLRLINQSPTAELQEKAFEVALSDASRRHDLEVMMKLMRQQVPAKLQQKAFEQTLRQAVAFHSESALSKLIEHSGSSDRRQRVLAKLLAMQSASPDTMTATALQYARKQPDGFNEAFRTALASHNFDVMIELIEHGQLRAQKQLFFSQALDLAERRGATSVMLKLLNIAPDSQKPLVFRRTIALAESAQKHQGSRVYEKAAAVAMAAAKEHPEIRIEALQKLAQYGDPKTAAYVSQLLSDDQPEVREQASIALKAIDSRFPLLALSRQIRPGMPQNPATAVAGLAQSRDPAGVMPLLEALTSGNSSLVEQARAGLKNQPHNLVRYQARDFARAHPEHSRALQTLLTHL